MRETKFKRKCVGCNTIKEKKDLLKITINKTNNEIKICPPTDFNGRSVYICKEESCVDAAFKKGKIFKFLKTKQDETLKEKISTVLEK